MKTDKASRFAPAEYNDPIYAAVFVGQLSLVLLWILYAAFTGKYAASEAAASKAVVLVEGGKSVTTALSDPTTIAVALPFGSVAIALAWSATWLLLLQKYPARMVYAAIVFCPAFMGCMSILCFIQGNMIGGLFTGLATVGLAFYVYYIWDRAKFTAKMFQSVSSTFSKSSGIFGLAFLSVIIQGLWMVVWFVAILPFYMNGNGGLALPALFVLLVSFYWGMQVVSYVLYVTCGGVVARHYFQEQVDTAVQSSAKQACTHYFGSICLGSLIIAVVQALRAICEVAKENCKESDNVVGQIVFMVIDCFLGCLESIARFFNAYVFAYIAVCGMNFADASGKVWDLLTNSDAEAIVNYSISDMVSTFGTIAGGILDAAITALIAWRLGVSDNYIVGASLLAFLIGFAIMSVVSRVMEAGVTTLFVCFAEDSSLLSKYDQALEDAVSQAMDVAKERTKLVK